MSFNYSSGGFSGNSIAIGYYTGTPTNKGGNSIAIGVNSGNTGQFGNAIALGSNAGLANQNGNAIAIGNYAGMTKQGQYAIAIGDYAGQTNQPANSIIINATGTAINGNANVGTCYIAPIRATAVDVSYSTYSFLKYNSTTNEVVNSPNTGAFLYRYNSVAQPITRTIDAVVSFDSSSNRSFGNTGLTYSAGTFLNASGSTLLLSVSATYGYASDASAMRAFWIKHSNIVFDRIVFAEYTAANSSDYTSCNLSSVFTLLPTETFQFWTWHNSSTLTPINLVKDTVQFSKMTATLLN